MFGIVHCLTTFSMRDISLIVSADHLNCNITVKVTYVLSFLFLILVATVDAVQMA